MRWRTTCEFCPSLPHCPGLAFCIWCNNDVAYTGVLLLPLGKENGVLPENRPGTATTPYPRSGRHNNTVQVYSIRREKADMADKQDCKTVAKVFVHLHKCCLSTQTTCSSMHAMIWRRYCRLDVGIRVGMLPVASADPSHCSKQHSPFSFASHPAWGASHQKPDMHNTEV